MLYLKKRAENNVPGSWAECAKTLRWARTVLLPGTGRNLRVKQYRQWWGCGSGKGWSHRGVRSQRVLIATLRNLAFILRGMGNHCEISSSDEAWSALHFRKMPLHSLQQGHSLKKGQGQRHRDHLAEHYCNAGMRKWLLEQEKCIYAWIYVLLSEWYLGSKNLQEQVPGYMSLKL